MRLPVTHFLAFVIFLGVACSGVHAQIIHESAKILPSHDRGRSGWAIAIDGNLAVIGAPQDSLLEHFAGTAYILDMSDPHNPIELFRINATDAAAGDSFGRSVAIGDGYIVVGAPSHDRDGETNAGVAYIFDAATGTQLHRLEPVDGFDRSDLFGSAVAISGGDVFVGAPGYGNASRGAIFRYDAVSGVEIAQMIPIDPRCCLDFGGVFAIDGDTLVAGTPSDRSIPSNSNSGSVFVFDLATNSQLYKFFAANPVENMYFGSYLAIEDGLVAIGTPSHSQANGIYMHDVTTGAQVYDLHHTGKFGFGNALAMNEGRLLIVQTGHSASAYLHDAPTGDYLGELVPSDSVYQHDYAKAVALDGEIVLIGAPRDVDTGVRGGATYLFQPEFLTSSCGPADLSVPYGTLNFFDISEYLRLFQAGDMAADLSEPFGSLDFFDVSVYLELFAAGCP